MKLVKASDAYKTDSTGMDALLQNVQDKIFSLTPREQELGLGDKVCPVHTYDHFQTPVEVQIFMPLNFIFIKSMRKKLLWS